jgi:hypothetical protein
MDSITIICLTLLFFFCLKKILTFYGVDQSSYATYMLFYMFMCLCLVVLPKGDPEF